MLALEQDIIKITESLTEGYGISQLQDFYTSIQLPSEKNATTWNMAKYHQMLEVAQAVYNLHLPWHKHIHGPPLHRQPQLNNKNTRAISHLNLTDTFRSILEMPTYFAFSLQDRNKELKEWAHNMYTYLMCLDYFPVHQHRFLSFSHIPLPLLLLLHVVVCWRHSSFSLKLKSNVWLII